MKLIHSLCLIYHIVRVIGRIYHLALSSGFTDMRAFLIKVFALFDLVVDHEKAGGYILLVNANESVEELGRVSTLDVTSRTPDNPLIVVAGPLGCGKSSVACAVMAALSASGFTELKGKSADLTCLEDSTRDDIANSLPRNKRVSIVTPMCSRHL